jgi:ABC-type sugar transport system ATPase subunit
VLRVKSFHRRFETFTLRADFEVDEREKVSLVGRSGSGKSTLMRWLAGLDREAGGELWLANERVDHLPPERRDFGWVTQTPQLFPSLSPQENLTFGLRVRGIGSKHQLIEGRRWLEKLGLDELVRDPKRPVERLSGGERQRLALGRALIWKPRVLLLDEPFSALDQASRESMRQLIDRLHREAPVPTVMVTHDPEDLRALAARGLTLSEDESRSQRRFGTAPVATR